MLYKSFEDFKLEQEINYEAPNIKAPEIEPEIGMTLISLKDIAVVYESYSKLTVIETSYGKVFTCVIPFNEMNMMLAAIGFNIYEIKNG